MVSLVRVFVATTEGPSEIQHVVEEDADVRSVICLNGTSEALPVSRDYDSFVRKPTGVIERLFGHPSYRVDVSRRISNGRSWQLGLLVAHALHAEGRLAAKDGPAEEVYWVTGEVRHNLDVMPVDHVGDKLRQSEALFDGLLHLQTKVTILVPTNNLDEAEAEFRSLGLDMSDVSVEGIRHWDEFAISSGPTELPPAAGNRTWRRLAVILFAIMVPVSAAAFLGSWWKGSPPHSVSVPLQPQLPSSPVAEIKKSPEPPPVESAQRVAPPSVEPPAAPSAASSPEVDSTKALPAPVLPLMVSAVERRAPTGSGCGRLRLTGDATVDAEIETAVPDGFGARPSAGLCEVEFRVANPSMEPRFIAMALRSTIDGAVPLTMSQMVSPGAFVSLKAAPNTWASGKPWTATLAVADLPSGADFSFDHLFETPAKRITSRIVTYTAVAPVEPRFR